ncbi:hypothetical protein [Paraburkholderia aspalathi]|uniref:hypothetical protein n=1 Tax=Paraburkholderia aspalathi TaxID=1324617 RepID=UPI001FCF9068|nr:hypothetical protein [Paraburkholderia aspalathi]
MSALPEQPAHEAAGRVSVAPASHQNIDHRGMLVHCPQKSVLSAAFRDGHFIKMPLVASRQSGGEPPPDLVEAPTFATPGDNVSREIRFFLSSSSG